MVSLICSFTSITDAFDPLAGLRPIEKRPKVNTPDKASRCKKPDEVSDPTSREAQLLRLNRVLGSESSSDEYVIWHLLCIQYRTHSLLSPF